MYGYVKTLFWAWCLGTIYYHPIIPDQRVQGLFDVFWLPDLKNQVDTWLVFYFEYLVAMKRDRVAMMYSISTSTFKWVPNGS